MLINANHVSPIIFIHTLFSEYNLTRKNKLFWYRKRSTKTTKNGIIKSGYYIQNVCSKVKRALPTRMNNSVALSIGTW